jgi:hypothetical protein
VSMFYLQETKDATENESQASIGVELQSLRGVATRHSPRFKKPFRVGQRAVARPPA